MRSLCNSKKTITATPRQLESMIRISEALAKMRLSDLVEKRDKDVIGKKIESLESVNPSVEIPEFSDYGYLIEWEQYAAPAALYEILDKDIRVKVANLPFTLNKKKYYRPIKYKTNENVNEIHLEIE